MAGLSRRWSLIVITVVAFNFIGDALQDSFDVRLQER